MKEIKGNVFDLALTPEVDAICITTNGIVGATGLATMGAGTAGEAARRWPNVRANLGKALNSYGNLPFVIGFLDIDGKYHDPDRKSIMEKKYKCLVWSFPTKNDFRFKSDINLIKQSAELMAQMVDELKLKNVILPRPGCTNGKLSWTDVKAVIEPILDDRFSITTFEGEE